MTWILPKLAASAIEGIGTQRANDRATRANEERYALANQLAIDQMMGGMGLYDWGMGLAGNEIARRQGQGLSEAQRLGAAANLGAMSRTQDVLGNFDRSAAALQGGYSGALGDFMNRYSMGTQGIEGGYGDRYRMASEQLENYGEQAARDIDRRFDDERGRVEQDLMNRGLMSSTVAGHDMMGSQERRSAEQRRLQENLMQNRVNTLGQFSADELAARERMLNQGAGFGFSGLTNQFNNAAQLQAARAAYDSALRGDELNMMTGMGQWQHGLGDQYSNQMAGFYGDLGANRANIFQQGMGNLQGLAVNRDDLAPQPINTLSQTLGWASNRPSGPSTASQVLPAIAGGAASLGIGALTGGLGFGAGFGLPTGGGFFSDVNIKENFSEIDENEILEKMTELPVTAWNYKATPEPHVGPMAQDFKKAFGVGGDDTVIQTVDAIGVLIASVKALTQRVKQLEGAVT